MTQMSESSLQAHIKLHVWFQLTTTRYVFVWRIELLWHLGQPHYPLFHAWSLGERQNNQHNLWNRFLFLRPSIHLAFLCHKHQLCMPLSLFFPNLCPFRKSCQNNFNLTKAPSGDYTLLIQSPLPALSSKLAGSLSLASWAPPCPWQVTSSRKNRVGADNVTSQLSWETEAALNSHFLICTVEKTILDLQPHRFPNFKKGEVGNLPIICVLLRKSSLLSFKCYNFFLVFY